MRLTGENSLLRANRGRIVNALVAAVFVTIGFALVWNPVPVLLTVVAGLGFMALLFWVGTTVPHVWAWACLFLGLESLSWSIVPFVKLRIGSVPPSDDQLIATMGPAFLGVFFATFWLTFAYGIFRWIRRTSSAGTSPPHS
jgi:hypothetical protein